MNTFLWSQGHIGWPSLAIVVFSVLCLLVTDAVWRTVKTSARSVLLSAGFIWAMGVIAILTISLHWPPT
jgi:hypothetical protein